MTAQTDQTAELAKSPPNAGVRRVWRPVPAEGENGLFTQSWNAVAWSSDVGRGSVIGRDFLDGRIVIYRGADNMVRAMSAYCPHLGADLSLGDVVENNLRCAFHHWQYDEIGQCRKTASGDPAPRGACLFVFPTIERYGIIFVFNGEQPLFGLPDFPIADEELVFGSPYPVQTLDCDPWAFCANTPDMQHLKVVHNINFNHADPHDRYNWHTYGFDYKYEADAHDGVAAGYTIGIRGTSIFYRHGEASDEFFRASIVGFGIPRPGKMVVYSVNGVRKGPKAEEQLAIANKISAQVFSEDREIMNTIHYRPGHLTQADLSLSRFLNYVRHYPRAHPSADFIN